MKKLLIAGAVTMLGIAAHAAAAAIWTAGEVYTFEGADKTSTTYATDYLVYYIDAGDYSYVTPRRHLGMETFPL